MALVRREEAVSEACHRRVETPVVGDERALPVGPVRGHEPLHLVLRAGTPERERASSKTTAAAANNPSTNITTQAPYV